MDDRKERRGKGGRGRGGYPGCDFGVIWPVEYVEVEMVDGSISEEAVVDDVEVGGGRDKHQMSCQSKCIQCHHLIQMSIHCRNYQTVIRLDRTCIDDN